ncbi:MAG: heme ABC exporter ATP-binding protein CcmA [Anaerolineae bacterium]|nr:heme ABC exporter ATP-binding protein CcmA [Anaerolineae bacterium]
MSAPVVVQAEGVSKSFGARTALAQVDLELCAGELVALLGPNGAGKTTLLRILATLARPTSGTVRLFGLDAARQAQQIRPSLSLLSHRTFLYDDLTAEQNLAFYARMYDLRDGAGRAAELLERVGLSHRQGDLVRTFSRGMQQRLALARALLHRPSLLLLDEPYSGLDPQAAETLSDLLVEMRERGCTVLLTTHDLAQGLSLAERVLVLARGRLVHDSPCSAAAVADFAGAYRRLTA